MAASLPIFVVAALSGLAVGQAPERDQTIQDCAGKVADVYFVLDSSTSIYVEDYRQELQFVRDVISRLDIGQDKTRVGALTFSDEIQVGFELERFRTKATTLAGVDERILPYRTGVTDTDKAIRYIRTNPSFKPDITKVIIVITDGVSRSPGLTAQEAEEARDAGFYLMVVGAGQYLDEGEWRAIASDPDSEFIFNITNFRLLETLRDLLPRRLCRLPPLVVRAECTVGTASDIFFLAAPNGANDALDIIEDISDSFVNKGSLNVQYIIDNCEDNLDTGFQGPDLYCNRFGDMPETDENTYVGLMTRMRSAATSLRTSSPGRKQVVVLFVDDQSILLNRFGILREARSLAQAGDLDVIVVDLGVRQYVNFVLGLTQNQENVINYVTPGASQAVRRLVDRLCAAVRFTYIEPV